MDDDVNKRVGRRVRISREMRGMTAQELADELSKMPLVHPATTNVISRWELGKQPIPTDSLVGIMTVLRVSPYFILGDNSPIDTEEQMLHNTINDLPKKEKRILLRVYTEWKGCAHCLMEICAMYMSLDECVRKVALRHLIRLFEKNRPASDPVVQSIDLDMVINGMLRLDKGNPALQRKEG